MFYVLWYPVTPNLVNTVLTDGIPSQPVKKGENLLDWSSVGHSDRCFISETQRYCSVCFALGLRSTWKDAMQNFMVPRVYLRPCLHGCNNTGTPKLMSSYPMIEPLTVSSVSPYLLRLAQPKAVIQDLVQVCVCVHKRPQNSPNWILGHQVCVDKVSISDQQFCFCKRLQVCTHS